MIYQAVEAYTFDLIVISEMLAAEHIRCYSAIPDHCSKRHQSYALSRKIRVTVAIEHHPCQMEIDTGSEFTIVSEYIFQMSYSPQNLGTTAIDNSLLHVKNISQMSVNDLIHTPVLS
ncbi:hypothetical protein T4C_11190 [Trichinella pseudospiralis]|uniref:Uncharacterized protein n=1 Tax=Trichinella pseudospiralis TaxID=6337 RepID=A0A0V1K5G7_TRIPS|nr:hypothetical protein T4C_11190 [Trichinella pseudospiralis]